MTKLTSFNYFINEKLGVNKDVKRITNFIFDVVMKNLTELKDKKILILRNYLQENYEDIIFFNDILIFYLSDNFNSGIIYQKNKKGIVISLKIEFNVNMINLKDLKKVINHELNHVIENLYSKELSKDWETYKRLREHQKKYEKYDFWIKISNLFYETLSYELRSRTSETYEYLKSKNTKDLEFLKKLIIESTEYKNLNNILKLNQSDILIIMKQKYDNYDEILTDFMENVFTKKYTEQNFIKLIDTIKSKVRQQIKKLFRLISTILYENSEYIEIYEPNKNINYCDYIEKHLKK